MTFADVVGHDDAAHRLRRAAAEDRTAGAYLLWGPVGIGKRTLANAFAAHLLCATRGAEDACATCAQCIRVAAGTHPDLHIVQRDEDRRDIRIDQARALTRWLGLRPLMAQRKVAIIDGADCLNEHGQNALLKTLEEPPGAAVLVLVATHVSLLLPTVRSRCQRIRLASLPLDAVRRFLRARGLPEARIELLAARAEGSPGRALALADDTSAELRATILERLAHLPESAAAELSTLAQAVARGPMEAALDTMVAWYRDVLELALLDHPRLRNPDSANAARAVATRLSPADILRQLEAVYDTIGAIGRNANRVLALETMLLALRRIERGPGADSAWTSIS